MNFRKLISSFKSLELDKNRPVLVHASVSSIGELRGGAEQLVGALIESFDTIITPTFTFNTLVSPETGPPNNAIEYGSKADLNQMAEIFYPDMPSDPRIGSFAEAVRKHPKATRSSHPILSFAGINAEKYLSTQSLSKPLAPIAEISKDKGYVMLLGVDHTKNVSIHLGEQLAGRKTFTRWALTSDMVAECENCPSCSKGFNAVMTYMSPFITFAKVGEAEMQVMQAHVLTKTVQHMVTSNPEALLCDEENCAKCNAVKVELK